MHKHHTGRHRFVRHSKYCSVRPCWSHSQFLSFISCCINSVASIPSPSMRWKCFNCPVPHGIRIRWQLLWVVYVWSLPSSVALRCGDVDDGHLLLCPVSCVLRIVNVNGKILSMLKSWWFCIAHRYWMRIFHARFWTLFAIQIQFG